MRWSLAPTSRSSLPTCTPPAMSKICFLIRISLRKRCSALGHKDAGTRAPSKPSSPSRSMWFSVESGSPAVCHELFSTGTDRWQRTAEIRSLRNEIHMREHIAQTRRHSHRLQPANARPVHREYTPMSPRKALSSVTKNCSSKHVTNRFANDPQKTINIKKRERMVWVLTENSQAEQHHSRTKLRQAGEQQDS